MCDIGEAPTPDPLIGEAAKANAEVAKEALSFYKDVYTNELLPMQKEQQTMGRTLIDRFLSNMDKQDRFADKQNAYYESTFQPIEQQVARDAMDYDSDANIDRRQGIAGASVQQAYGNALGESARNLSRYGMNLNSSGFANTNERLMRSKALDSAGAQTGAAFDTGDRGIALRAGAANFGRNMPNTAASYYGLAGASGNSAFGTSTGMQNQAGQNAGLMQSGFNTSISGYQSAAGIGQADYNSRMNSYNQQQAGIGSLIGLGVTAATGGMAGGWAGAASALTGRKFASGGAVHGPGGPVDDKIPAMLSNGEYVIPADVVKAKGVEFFDKLKAKYHTSAAQQRRAAIERA